MSQQKFEAEQQQMLADYQQGLTDSVDSVH